MKHQPSRNGDFLLFEGNLYDADAVLSWIMDEETLEIPGVIEEVGTRMLNRYYLKDIIIRRQFFDNSFRILDEERDVLVFFYEDEEMKSLSGVFKSLEIVDDVIDSKDIEFVKISDEKIEVEFALDKLPTLVYFENKIPIEYDGE